MAKKPRPEPYTQGAMGTIYRLFFGPIIQNHKPKQMEIDAFMEELFDFKNRDITRYVARRHFVLPGLYRLAPNMKVQGIGYRDVKAGTEVFVRRDARNPDTIDVEFMGGQGGKDQVFALSLSEWNHVAPHLREEERERKK